MNVNDDYVYIVLECVSLHHNYDIKAIVFDTTTYDDYVSSHRLDNSNSITLVLNPRHPKFIEKCIDLEYIESTSVKSIECVYDDVIPVTKDEEEIAIQMESDTIFSIEHSIQNVKDLMIDTYFKFTKEEMVIIDE